ncbi:MAG: tRNA threonylcarbamoyladenosine dehydratase [Oscillospiraceae bacterium]|nr:tRNA threonylcarbamoyladenosine dehydratase [Oscillospiraceae bacterium]
MLNEFSRQVLLMGRENLSRLKNSHVAVFGVGGVGSYTAEALARAGIGHITLVDNDTVNITNINRQLIALHSTIGMQKTEAAKARILDINPECHITAINQFYTGSEIELSGFDWIADAIDTVSSKLALIENAHRLGVNIISCMGTGNKLDPTKLILTDISKTSMCPLAKVIRTELRKRGILHHPVVYSAEQPVPHREESEEDESRRKTIGSISFVPSSAGLIMAGKIINSIIDL